MSLPFFGGRRYSFVSQGLSGVTLATFANGTFSRSSNGTYLTSATTVAEASTNVLRLEDRGDGNGSVPLFEGARTNLAVYSSSLGSWTAGPATNSGTTNYGTSPLGTTTAARLVKSATGSFGPYSGANIGGTKAGTLSVWMTNNGGGTATRLRFSFASGIALPITIPSAWSRFSTYTTFTGAASDFISFDHRANIPNTGDPVINTAVDALVWGVQLEAVVTFPSSAIINNSGASATRSADTLTLTTAQYNAAMLDRPWRFDVYPYFSSTDHQDGETYWLYSFGGANDGIYITKSGGNATVAVVTGGVVRVSSSTITWSRHQKLTVTVTPAAGQVTIAGATTGNGTQTGTAYTFPSSTLRVGGILSGTGEAFCRISQPVGV